MKKNVCFLVLGLLIAVSVCAQSKDVLSVDTFKGESLVVGKDDALPTTLRLGLTVFLNKHKADKFDVFNSVNLFAVAEEQERQSNDWYETSLESKGFANANLILTGRIVKANKGYTVYAFVQNVNDETLSSVAQTEVSTTASEIESGIGAAKVGIEIAEQLGVTFSAAEKKSLTAKPKDTKSGDIAAINAYAQAEAEEKRGDMIAAQKKLLEVQEKAQDVALLKMAERDIAALQVEVNTSIAKNGLRSVREAMDYMELASQTIAEMCPFEVHYSPKFTVESTLGKMATVSVVPPTIELNKKDLDYIAEAKSTIKKSLNTTEANIFPIRKDEDNETIFGSGKSTNWIPYRCLGSRIYHEEYYLVLHEDAFNDKGKRVFSFAYVYAYSGGREMTPFVEKPRLLLRENENKVFISDCDSENWTFKFTLQWSKGPIGNGDRSCKSGDNDPWHLYIGYSCVEFNGYSDNSHERFERPRWWDSNNKTFTYASSAKVEKFKSHREFTSFVVVEE